MVSAPAGTRAPLRGRARGPVAGPARARVPLALSEIERLLAEVAELTRVAGFGLTGLVADPANEPKLARFCAALGL